MIKATVKKVIDGDTIEVNATFRVRLDFVDAPETKGLEKEKGVITKQYLKDRLEGETISLDVKKQDIYDRMLAVVYLDGENINGELVKKGLAEIYAPKNHNNNIED